MARGNAKPVRSMCRRPMAVLPGASQHATPLTSGVVQTSP